MEAPPGNNGAYEAPGTFKTLYRKVQGGLRRLSGVQTYRAPISEIENAREDLSVIDENELRIQSDYYIPDGKRDGQTHFVFGRTPEVKGEGYEPYTTEQQVKLMVNDLKIPRRVVAILFHPNGDVTIRNAWRKNITWGLSEKQQDVLTANGNPVRIPSDKTADLRIDIPGGYKLRAGSIGGAGNEQPKLRSLTFDFA
jgi:hypothetical protein